jgi:hypothetical protein
MIPTIAKANASLPPAATTGATTCDRDVTSTAAGRSTTVANAAIANDSMPPSGKPTRTLSRDLPRSFTLQPSSTAPDEKKNTSYGVIAAPKRATAKYYAKMDDTPPWQDG